MFKYLIDLTLREKTECLKSQELYFKESILRRDLRLKNPDDVYHRDLNNYHTNLPYCELKSPEEKVNHQMAYAIKMIAFALTIGHISKGGLHISRVGHESDASFLEHLKYTVGSLMLLGRLLPDKFDHRALSSDISGFNPKDGLSSTLGFGSESLDENEFKKHLKVERIEYYLTLSSDEIQRETLRKKRADENAEREAFGFLVDLTLREKVACQNNKEVYLNDLKNYQSNIVYKSLHKPEEQVNYQMGYAIKHIGFALNLPEVSLNTLSEGYSCNTSHDNRWCK